MMQAELKFSLEVVDGDQLGKLNIPFTQVARWFNVLTSPHYNVQILHTEQDWDGVTIYFAADEAMYWYVSDRANSEISSLEPSSWRLAS